MDSRRFTHSVRIRPLDCDRQGVVGHQLYLNFFEAALIELSAAEKEAFGKAVAANTELMNIARGFLT